MRLEVTLRNRRPLLARTPRTFGVFLLVRLSQAFAVVVLAVAALLGFTAFARPGDAPSPLTEEAPSSEAVSVR